MAKKQNGTEAEVLSVSEGVIPGLPSPKEQARIEAERKVVNEEFKRAAK